MSVDDVRPRTPDFDAVRDRIRWGGTDSLEYFLDGYTHEGGLLIQQNPGEFAALTVFLRERGPHAEYMEIGSDSGGAYLFLYREWLQAHPQPRQRRAPARHRASRALLADQKHQAVPRRQPRTRGASVGLPFRLDEGTLESGMNFTLNTDLGDTDLLGEVMGAGD